MTFRTIIRTFGLLLLLAAFSCKRPHGVVEALPPFAETDTSQVDAVLANLNLEEKIGQLILWDAPMTDSLSQEEVFQKTSAGLVGGLLLHNVHLATFLYATDSLKRSASIPLFIGSDEKVSLHNQFKGLLKFPLPATLAAIDSVSIHAYLEKKYVADCKALGINLTLNPTLKTDVIAAQGFDYQVFEEELPLLDERFDRMFEQLKSNRILAIADNFAKFEFIKNDSLRRVALNRYQTIVNKGLGGLLVDNSVLSQDTLKVLPPSYPKTYLSRFIGFKGLMVVQLAQDEVPNKKLLAGAEMLVTKSPGAVFEAVQSLLESGEMTEQDLNQRVRRVLLAKSWVHGGQLPVKLSILPQDTTTHKPVKFVSISEKRQPDVVKEYKPRSPNFDAKVDKTVCYFEDPRWGFYVGKLFGNSVILARDQKDFLPLKGIYDTDYQVFKYSPRAAKDFETLFSKYAKYRLVDQPVPASGELKPVVFQKTSLVPAAIVLLDNVDLKPGFHKQFIESINELAKESQVVLLNFGNPKNLRFFEPPVTIVQIFEKNPFTEAYAAQLLFGGVRSEGRLPVTVDETLAFGAGVRHQAVRLAFADAENVGIASDRLAGINAIAQTAITNGVFPGCQVAVAKDGQIIFSKSFGHFTYGKTAKAVQNTDLYDIASLTKVASTTLAAMKLVENKVIDLEGKVSDYLTLPPGAAVGNIKIKQLLLHQSGLQAQMPLARFFSGKNVPAKGCNDYFCRKRKGGYSVKVADGLYFRETFQDTIRKRVFNLKVVPKPQFRYSDVNFYLLKSIVEVQTNTPMETYVFEQIYRPLGLRRITYKPMQKFAQSNLVPTEQDNYWRKTLVQGYVHDPGVALLGGVGGSAGVFSNAEDLAVLFQMLLKEGEYGGAQFYDKSTVEEFVSEQSAMNHRGLGFDKPTKRKYPTYSPHASAKSYGHTGFTGTCAWVDPEQRLVYVFLSNRVNPSSHNGKIFTENVRSRIHEVVYGAFDSFDSSLPAFLDSTEEEIEMEEGAGG